MWCASKALDDEERVFTIGIGKAAQLKWAFKVGDVISGLCLPVFDPDLDPVEYYKVSQLAREREGSGGSSASPWELVCPPLEVYRERGHRRLAAITYEKSCQSCMWAARMATEIIIDNWNPESDEVPRETFCTAHSAVPSTRPGHTESRRTEQDGV